MPEDIQRKESELLPLNSADRKHGQSNIFNVRIQHTPHNITESG